MKKYALEIYLPGNSGYDVAYTIESDHPFMPIAKGDFINPRTWPTHNYQQIDHEQCPHGVLLRVTGLEHFITEVNGVAKHKIGIFTEAIDDVAESRITKARQQAVN